MDSNQTKPEDYVPFVERRKEWMKTYMRDYMREYHKAHKVKCDCGCEVFRHALAKHRQSLKHRYLLTIREESYEKF